MGIFLFFEVHGSHVLGRCADTEEVHNIAGAGQAAVKIILRLTWVTFAVGTQWSALGVGVGLREGRERRGRPSEMRRERERRDGRRTELNE